MRVQWALASGPVGKLRVLAMHHLVHVVWLSILLVLAIQSVIRQDSEWQDVYVAAARTLLSGKDLYAPGPYLYPPFSALLAVPFVALPTLAVRLVWYGVNVAALGVLLYSAWCLAAGPRFRGAGSVPSRDWYALALGALGCAPYWLNTLAHQQTDLVIAALLTAGCFVMIRDRIISGAVLIGLAAAFKGPPLLFVGYLVFRRRWLAACVTTVVALSANLLPDLIAHPADGTWLGRWVGRILLPTISAPVGTWNADQYNIFNQSLSGTLQRLATSTWSFDTGGLVFSARDIVIEPTTLKAIVYALMLAMLVLSIGAALFGERASPNVPVDGRPGRAAIEMTAMIVLVLLMSPMSGLSHFATLAAAMMCLSRMALVERHRPSLIAFGIALVSALAVNKDLVGATAYDLVLWSGVTTASAIALWLACLLLLICGKISPSTTAFSRTIF
jgi:hypothetical protein